MAANEPKLETDETMRKRLGIETQSEFEVRHQPKTNNGLKVGEVSAIKPMLENAHDQAWLLEYQAIQEQVTAQGRALETMRKTGTYDTPEGKALRKDLLQAEYQQNHYVDEGYQNERVKSGMNVEYKAFNKDKVDGMIYRNDGKPPQPDISDAKVARNAWLSGKWEGVKQYFKDAQDGAVNINEAAKPISKEIIRAAGAAAIDSIGPTPSKLLLLPKTHLPQMDYLRDGVMDDAAGRTGIPSPGNAIMDKALGPAPDSTKKQLGNPLGLHSSLDEDLTPNANNKQMADAFLYGNPHQVIKEFPALASAYTLQAATQKQLELGGYHAQEQVIVMAQVNVNIANSIQTAQVPQAEIKAADNTVTAQREARVEMSREFA